MMAIHWFYIHANNYSVSMTFVAIGCWEWMKTIIFFTASSTCLLRYFSHDSRWWWKWWQRTRFGCTWPRKKIHPTKNMPTMLKGIRHRHSSVTLGEEKIVHVSDGEPDQPPANGSTRRTLECIRSLGYCAHYPLRIIFSKAKLSIDSIDWLLLNRMEIYQFIIHHLSSDSLHKTNKTFRI